LEGYFYGNQMRKASEKMLPEIRRMKKMIVQ